LRVKQGLTRARVSGKGIENPDGRTMPDHGDLVTWRLPDARQLLNVIENAMQEGASDGNGPGGVGHDETTKGMLPSVQSQWASLSPEDGKSQRRYRRILEKTTGRIDRKWARLAKLRAGESRLQAPLGRIARDIEAWQAQVERYANDPRALDDILDGQARALEARIEETYRQAVEWRRRRVARDSSQRPRKWAERVRSLRGLVGKGQRQPRRPIASSASHEAEPAVSPDRAATAAGLSEDEAAWVENDSCYLQGVAHLQTGDWEAAIGCFEDLLSAHPGSERVQEALDQARFKASVDATTRVRARYWMVPWGRVMLYLSVVGLTGLLAVIGTQVFRNQVSPALAEFQMERQIERQRKECRVLREADDLDAAEDCCKELLALDPSDEEAKQGLQDIEERRELERLYEKGLGLEAQGDNLAANDWEQAQYYHESALETYTEVLMRSPQYGDVPLRITGIRQKLKLADLFAGAEANYEAGRFWEALEEYQQVSKLNGRYHRDLIDGRLFHIYMLLGTQIVEHSPPTPEMLPSALDYFEEALTLQPRSAEAVMERRLASLFIEGQTRYYRGYPDDAIPWLRQVYDQRPGYLGGILVDTLYDAYIRAGDASRAAGDIGLAYEQYRKAASLSVTDKALALARLESITPYLTPTATPTVTPTATRTPLPTPTPKPTPIPPPKPLAAYHRYIAFYSSNEERPGIWVMDSAGGDRRYLGESSSPREQYDALVEEQRYSPDHRYYLFVRDAGKSAQIHVLLPRHEQYGDLAPQQLTKLSGICYDPVWSPDGARVAFVSEESKSDDIWVINPDGTKPRNLTGNTWEWDKHPSWSPDSRWIVFWSNREGHGQIYVMDADGHNVRNISNTEWEEYDPIWIP